MSPPPITGTGIRRWLVAILAVGAFLRFWHLGSVPPGLFRDEIEKGWTAFELWHTGRQAWIDVDGSFVVSRRLPVFIDAVGVKTSAIYQYLSAPVVGIFGLGRFTTRFVAAACGSLTVLAAFALARVLESGGHIAWCGREPAASDGGLAGVFPLAAAAFTAVSPTHVLFSRWAQQGITVPLLATLGIALLLHAPCGAARHRRAAVAVGGLLLGAAFYAYDPARLVVPFILVALAIEMRAPIGRLVRLYWPAALLFLAIAVPVFAYATTQGGARFQRVSVFGGRSLPEAAVLAAANYVRHFDPIFLFVSGDANPRHAMPFSGVVAWAEGPFFLAGIASLAMQRRRAGSALLLGWLLAAPLAAALTNDGVPHALRSILFWPVVHLVSARGVVVLAERIRWRLALPACATAVVVAGLLAFAALEFQVRREAAPWNFGVLEALEAMDRANPDGPNALSAEVGYAHYFALFHERPDPLQWQEQGPQVLRTSILAPGTPLPDRGLVARPNVDPFARRGPFDVPALSGDPTAPPAMTVRPQW